MRLQQFVALCLAIIFLFSGCTTPAIPQSSGNVPVPPSSSSVPSLPEDPPAYVKDLAADLAEELGLTTMEPYDAVEVSYRYLVEEIYFSDPVGLDLWRYLSDEIQPISYLENRSLSPLLFQIGSCEDFAAVQVLLLQAAGLEAQYVAGYTLSVDQVFIDHAWAVVLLEGNWYHLDPQLEQNVTRSGSFTYRYFLKRDEDLLIDHRWGENLVELWPNIPQEEQQQIRTRYTPPPCTTQIAPPDPRQVPHPQTPNMSTVEGRIRQMKAESGKGELPPMLLHVEPPILVAEKHITPPLLPEYMSAPLRYGQSFLEADPLVLYQQLLTAAEDPANFRFVTVPPQMSEPEIYRVIDSFIGDYPEYYWAQFRLSLGGNREVLQLEIKNQLTITQLEERQRLIENRAYPLIDQTIGKSPFERAVILHDWLAGELTYDYGESDSGDGGNLYGALVGQLAYCDGYAKGFQYLANLAGLDTIFIRGLSFRGITHGWNAVFLEDGYYYVDTTWDRPRGYYDQVYHDYFAMSLEESGRERLWDSTQYPQLPPTSSTKWDYYPATGYAIVEGESGQGEVLVDRLSDLYLLQLEDRELSTQHQLPVFLEIKIIGSTQYYNRWKQLYVKEIFAILRSMDDKAVAAGLPYDISTDTSVSCDFNDTMQVITFYPKIRTTKEELF